MRRDLGEEHPEERWNLYLVGVAQVCRRGSIDGVLVAVVPGQCRERAGGEESLSLIVVTDLDRVAGQLLPLQGLAGLSCWANLLRTRQRRREERGPAYCLCRDPIAGMLS